MLPTLQDTLFQATIDGFFELFIPHNSFIYIEHATLEFLALMCHVETKQIILVVTEESNVQKLFILQLTVNFDFNFY